MAVTKVASSKAIAIEVQNGKDSKGDPTYTKKSFSGIRNDVDIQSAYDVAEAIKGVLEEPTRAYFLNSSSTLQNA